MRFLKSRQVTTYDKKNNNFKSYSGVDVKVMFCFSVPFIICYFVMALMSFMVFVGHPGTYYTILYMYPLLAVDLFLAYNSIKSTIHKKKEIRKKYKIDGIICNMYDDFYISYNIPLSYFQSYGKTYCWLLNWPSKILIRYWTT